MFNLIERMETHTGSITDSTGWRGNDDPDQDDDDGDYHGDGMEGSRAWQANSFSL